MSKLSDGFSSRKSANNIVNIVHGSRHFLTKIQQSIHVSHIAYTFVTQLSNIRSQNIKL